MKIKLRGHADRTARAKEFWQQVLADYNAGMSAVEIANRYRNPITGKPYTREHIYFILRKFNNN